MLTVSFVCERCGCESTKKYKKMIDIIPDIEDRRFIYNEKYICQECLDGYSLLRKGLSEERTQKIKDFWGEE